MKVNRNNKSAFNKKPALFTFPLYMVSIGIITILGFILNHNLGQIFKLNVIVIMFLFTFLIYFKMFTQIYTCKKINLIVAFSGYMISLISVHFIDKLLNIPVWMLGILLIVISLEVDIGLLFHMMFCLIISLNGHIKVEHIIYTFLLGFMLCLLAKKLTTIQNMSYIFLTLISSNFILLLIKHQMLLDKTICVEWILSSLTLFFILYVTFRLTNKYNLLSELEENHYINSRDNLEEQVNLQYAATQELEMKPDAFNTNQSMEAFYSFTANQSKLYDAILNNNDTLINKMKEIRIDRYNHSLEVSKLSSYVSNNINMNSNLLKAAGMYHEIFKILDIKNIQKGTKYLQDIHFPEDLIHMIIEQYENPKSPKTLEALVLLLSDSIITTMDFIKQKQEKKNVKAVKIVENVFNHHLKNGVFDDLPISLHAYRTLKEYYISYFKE